MMKYYAPKKRDQLGLIAIFFFCIIPFGQSQPAVQKAVETYLEDVKVGGLVISVIRLDTYEIQAFGQVSKENPLPPQRTSGFEIGAVSQLFTNLLMLVAEQEEVILPEVSIQEYFPEETATLAFQSLICREVQIFNPKQTKRGETKIACRPDPFQSGICMSFCDLALHNSGLPLTLPGGFDWNPFVELDRWAPHEEILNRDTFFNRLDQIELIAPPGHTFKFSNIGPALLGQLLASAYKQPFKDILKEKVLDPLQLEETGLNPSNLLPGHNHKGRRVAPIKMDAQLPAAGLHSNVEDLSKLLLNFLNPPNQDWEKIFETMRQDRIEVHFPTAPSETLAGYGFFSTPIKTGQARRAYWQYGGTGGFRTFIAFVPATKTGLVLLTNQPLGLTQLGFQLLDTIQPSSRP